MVSQTIHENKHTNKRTIQYEQCGHAFTIISPILGVMKAINMILGQQSLLIFFLQKYNIFNIYAPKRKKNSNCGRVSSADIYYIWIVNLP